MSEKFADAEDSRIKYGIGPRKTLRALSEISESIAGIETAERTGDLRVYDKLAKGLGIDVERAAKGSRFVTTMLLDVLISAKIKKQGLKKR